MPAKDFIHDAVKNALIKDGWTITDDPLTLKYEEGSVLIDLGAERVIAAQRGNEKIAVEIKSFIGHSVIHDVQSALGQYVIYLDFLELKDPERKLYLAISHEAYVSVFTMKVIQMLIRRNQVPLIVVDIETEEVIQWNS